MTSTEEPYRVLTSAQRDRLRAERVHQLEADHYRGALMLEDAQSAGERETIAAGMDDIAARLSIHYAAMGL